MPAKRAYPELLILRHGETEWNSQGRMQGHLDSPLTELGRQQAQRQGALLRGFGVAGRSVFCSPQGRAFHTAALALGGVVGEMHTDSRLREIGMGAWQARTRDEILAQTGEGAWLDAPFALYVNAPGGEGFVALADRCAAFLDALSGPAILVTHGITSRMLRQLALGLDPLDIPALESLPGGQGVVYVVKDRVQQRLE